MDPANNKAVCVAIGVAAAHNGINILDARGNIPISTMVNWVAFSPDTWANIQAYLNDLKILAQKQCQLP